MMVKIFFTPRVRITKEVGGPKEGNVVPSNHGTQAERDGRAALLGATVGLAAAMGGTVRGVDLGTGWHRGAGTSGTRRGAATGGDGGR